MSEPKIAGRRRLFWRIFRHGILLLFAVALSSVFFFFHFVDPHEQWQEYLERMAVVLGNTLDKGSGEQPRLQELLDDIQFVANSPMAVFTFEGRRLAVAGELPPAPLDSKHLLALEKRGWLRTHGHDRLVALVLRTRHQKAYLLATWPHREGALEFAIGLTLVLGVIALFSWPLARAMARPLEQLTETARKLASGDLSQRTGMDRRDEIGILARTMDEMAERLETKVHRERELLADVSHEIRTPLARIKVALELCEEEGISPLEIERNLKGIAEDAADLDQLLEDVLAISRLDLAESERGNAGFAVRTKRVDIGEVIANSVASFEARYPGRAVSMDIDSALPTVDADPRLLRRLIENLLDNAAKYSGEQDPIEVRVTRDAGNLSLTVADRGCGIEGDERHRIFEPFYRAEGARESSSRGTGLGLALCKRIAQAHHGAIQALPREGGGTVFRLELPLG